MNKTIKKLLIYLAIASIGTISACDKNNVSVTSNLSSQDIISSSSDMPSSGIDNSTSSSNESPISSSDKPSTSSEHTHVLDEPVKEENVDATCLSEGSYHLRAYCKECHELINDELVIVPALGHNYQFDSFVWNDDFSAKAKFICSNDQQHVEMYDADVTSQIVIFPTESSAGQISYTATYQEHVDSKLRYVNELTFISWETTIEATCYSNGEERRYCNECSSYFESRSTSKKDHEYSFDRFIWETTTSEYSASAYYKCIYSGEDNPHGKSYKVYVDKQVIKEPTCTELGVMRYTASFDGHSDSIEGPIDYHNYQNGVCPICGAIEPQKGYIYRLNEDQSSYSIIGYTGDESELIFPSTYLGLPVTVIGGDNYNQTSFVKNHTNLHLINSVVIPDSVTTITKMVFDHYSSSHLNRITLGKNVTTIETNAFFDANKLVEIYNKSSLNLTKGSSEYGNIARYARDIYIEEDYESKLAIINDGFVIYREGEEVTLLNYIGHDLFVKIPEEVTAIDKNAFSTDRHILRLEIPATVQTINFTSLAAMNNLKEIYNLTSYTFASSGEYDVYVPTSVQAIHTTNLEESIFDIDSNGFVTMVEDEIKSLYYYIGSADRVNLPNDIDVIQNYAFCGNKSIKYVFTNEGLKEIGAEVFGYCDNLLEVSISSTVEKINNFFLGDYETYGKKINFASPTNWQTLSALTLPVWDFSDSDEARHYFSLFATNGVLTKAI